MAIPTTDECVQRVRSVCLALPGVTERLSHGEAVLNRALANKEKALGTDHRDVATALGSLAAV